MPTVALNTILPVYRTIVLLTVLILLLPACSTTREQYLVIDDRKVTGLQNMTNEISSLMDSLGYQWLPIRDPATGQNIKIITRQGRYEMLYQARDAANIQVHIHIETTGSRTRLRVHDVGKETLGEQARQHRQELKDRLMLVFGKDSVHDRNSFFAPQVYNPL